MNRIDFIIKNFQAANFLKDLKKEISSGWGEDEVLKNYIDFNDLEYQLNYLKLSKADIPKKVDAYLHGNLDIKKLILDFFKKKLPINKNTLNKYFIKKTFLICLAMNLIFAQTLMIYLIQRMKLKML